MLQQWLTTGHGKVEERDVAVGLFAERCCGCGKQFAGSIELRMYLDSNSQFPALDGLGIDLGFLLSQDPRLLCLVLKQLSQRDRRIT